MLEDREYQLQSIEDLRAGFREKHKRQVLAAPTGSGKSVIMLEMIKKALEKGSRIAFICERRILVDQFSKHLDAHGIDHGVLMSKHWRFRPYEKVQIASAQTLEKMESWPDFDIVFIDEIHACFVAGTKVDGRPIEEIEVGDYVNSYNHDLGVVEKKKVLHAFKHESSTLVKVSPSNTVPIVCTQDHPFFTGEDYENAKYLTNASVLYSLNLQQHGCTSEKTILSTNHTALQVLRGSVPADINRSGDLQESRDVACLQKGAMSIGSERTEHSNESTVNENLYGEWWSGKNEDRESNVNQRDKGQSQKQTSGNRAQAKSSWRQWLRDAGSSAVASICPWGWLGSRASNLDGMQEGARRSNMSEGGHSPSGLHDCDRAGRGKPQQFNWTGKGRQEVLSLNPVGVDSVEIQEQGCTGKHGCNSNNDQKTYVFNIEVEDNHNYFVEGVLVHNCMRASIKNMMKTRPDMRVIGATATPFNPELGKYFTRVTSVISMSELVRRSYLVPFRVFVAREIDTTGLKVVAGEWQKDELEKRGQQIVGDVVADYIRISNEVFGGYRKTICFSCGIAHGADLAQKFNEAGVNAVQISSSDEDQYRADVLADFAKPDSEIKVLISVAILSRGFDQTDVEHVILARPLKKSFSEHVQMVGRGARSHPDKEMLDKKFCCIQDNSGNWLRFLESWDELYENGVQSLEDGQDKKARKEPTEGEKSAAKCPRCGHLWGNSDMCSNCGAVRVRRNDVMAIAGEMTELTHLPKKEKHSAEYKADFYAQLLGWAEAHNCKPGMAYYKYKDKFGVAPSMAKPDPIEPGRAVNDWMMRQFKKNRKQAA